jgi:hypothetical protein
MSIHKVTNIFVGNGSALEANVSTLTPGKLGVFKANQTALGAAEPYVASSATEAVQVSETFADGTFKKSMWINGRSVIGARSESYAPAQREVWAIGHNRKTAAGTIEVNNATEYTFSINFKNDKSLYSERPEVLRGNFISGAAATQLSIATQIAAVINNGGFKSLVEAVVVGDGTGVYGLTGATDYGVEITAKDIEQFQSSTYKENRVYFSVQVDDSTGFGATSTCTQIQANSFGQGTYKAVYNKENFDYQYEGLVNRRLWPAQQVKFNVNSTPVLSAAITPVATGTTGEDEVTFDLTIAAIIRPGELVEIDGVNYEVKYIKGTGTGVTSANAVVLTTPLTTSPGSDAAKVRLFYDVFIIEFNDNSFTTGADVISQARKSVYIATPAIDAGGAYNSVSTEGTALGTNLNAWLATTPAAPQFAAV